MYRGGSAVLKYAKILGSHGQISNKNVLYMFPDGNVDLPPKLEFGARCWMSHVQVTRWTRLHCCNWLCLQMPAYNCTVPAEEQHVFRETLRSVVNRSTLMTLKMCH